MRTKFNDNKRLPTKEGRILRMLCKQIEEKSHLEGEDEGGVAGGTSCDAILRLITKLALPVRLIIDLTSLQKTGQFQPLKPRPESNVIEIVRQFMRCQWMEIEAYKAWSRLVQHVEKVLTGFGEECVINFANYLQASQKLLCLDGARVLIA